MSLAHHSDANAALVALIKPLATRPGFVSTLLPEVHVVSMHSYVASSPQIYEPSLMLGELVQAMGVTPDLIVEAQTPESMTSAVLDAPMRESVERLLRCLHDPLECQVMGQSRLREVLYAALRGPQAGVLRALVAQQSHFARVAASLAYLHSHYDQPLNVDILARQANMSASTFHEYFKRSTLLSPVQYLKRLRLLKAQQMLVAEGLGVAQVAHRVGYQSTSQFSREYKRYFNRSPGEEGISLRIPA